MTFFKNICTCQHNKEAGCGLPNLKKLKQPPAKIAQKRFENLTCAQTAQVKSNLCIEVVTDENQTCAWGRSQMKI